MNSAERMVELLEDTVEAVGGVLHDLFLYGVMLVLVMRLVGRSRTLKMFRVSVGKAKFSVVKSKRVSGLRRIVVRVVGWRLSVSLTISYQKKGVKDETSNEADAVS